MRTKRRKGGSKIKTIRLPVGSGKGDEKTVDGLNQEIKLLIEEGKKRGEGDNDPWLHPVIQAGIVQHRLVWIHPFVDGNGRSARMFTTLLLYQRGYDFKYLFELSSYYNADRDRYYAALRTADRRGEYTDWLVYFLGGFASQMMQIEKRVEKGRLE